jgi:hypothetical protein
VDELNTLRTQCEKKGWCCDALEQDLIEFYNREGLNFNDRERQILYGILSGLSRHSLAGDMNIKRSTLSSLISRGIGCYIRQIYLNLSEQKRASFVQEFNNDEDLRGFHLASEDPENNSRLTDGKICKILRWMGYMD